MTEPVTSDIYRSICLAQANRVIAAVDRNVLSPTYGCCDWKYWHDKMIDVPSGHDQEMAYFLALLYTSDFEGNPFFHHPWILELAKAALGFWCRLVGKSGSLDEFYPNEAQFGATAIVAWAAAETYRLLSLELTEQERSRVLEGLEHTAHWLTANDEQTNLANHQAQAMLALFRIHQLTGVQKFHQGYTSKRLRLFGLFHAEGWFEEYNYFDPGYQTTCLSFLARLHACTGEELLLNTVLQCLDHLKYCVLPHYHFGAELGSRRTRHIWPSCFELFTRQSSVARAMAVHYRTGLARNLVHDPRDQDRYFVQQLYDYLWISGVAEKTIDHCEPLPFWSRPFNKYFPESGIIAIKNRNLQCLAINTRKGGTYTYCKLDRYGQVMDGRADAGIAALTVTNEVLTSDFCGGENLVEVQLTGDLSTIEVKGNLYLNRFLYPHPGRFLLFRLFTFFLARWQWISRKFRYFLARLLMLERDAGEHGFARIFSVSPDEIKITSKLILKTGGKQKVKRVLFGAEASSVYVPISKGFDLLDASPIAQVLITPGQDQVERTDILS